MLPALDDLLEGVSCYAERRQHQAPSPASEEAMISSLPMRDPAALREFAAREWAAAARDKERYWRDYKREHGPAAGVRIADELRRQVLAARPDWPSDREREEDLATHLRVIEAIRRVPPRPR